MFILAQTLVSNPAHNFVNHWDDMLLGATAIGIIAHALDTFPVPNNPYAKWLLGTAQYIVGQRSKALATRNGTEPR